MSSKEDFINNNELKMSKNNEDAKWYDPLPRASWAIYPEMNVKETWFKVHKLPGDVYAIYEDGQWQEVISYLIIGQNKAILWDTGLGIGDIKSVVSELTELPITVVISHTHFDHIGSNALFDEIYVFDSKMAVEDLKKGLTHEEIKRDVEEDSIWKPLPEGFKYENFFIKGKAPTKTLKDGEIIDLGNRKLEVVHTPGHSPDSIMLIDEGNKILFSGDAYYPAPLYAYAKGADFKAYVKSMEKIVNKIKDKNLNYIYASHNEVVEGTEILNYILESMKEIVNGEKTDYKLDEEGRRVYRFDNNVELVILDVGHTI